MRNMPGSQHPAGTGVGSRPVRDPAADQHPMRAHPPTYSGSPVGDVTAFDRNMTAEDAMVHDTLCAMQAPTGLVRLSEAMAAAGLRTLRGTGWHPNEVKRVLERLLAAGHATRDAQGRIRAAAPHGTARFAEMMRDPQRARAWFDAWRKLVQFEHVYSLGFQEEEQLAAAMRLVIYGGGTLEAAGPPGHAGLHLHAPVERRIAPSRAAALRRHAFRAARAGLAGRSCRPDDGGAERVCGNPGTSAGRLAAGPSAKGTDRGVAVHAAAPGRDAAVPRRPGGRPGALCRFRHRRCRADGCGVRHGRRPLGTGRQPFRGGLEDDRRGGRAAQEPGLAGHRLDLRDGAAGPARAGRLEQGAQVRRRRSRQA